MPEDEMPKNRLGALEALYEFLEGPEEDVAATPLERILKSLEKEKLDPAPVVQMVRQRLAAARAAESLALARAERAHIDELRAQASTASPAEGVRNRVRFLLDGLSGSRTELAAAYYRKFEQATDADLESMLNDLELLDKMGREDGHEP